MAASLLLTKRISPAVSGSSISLPFLQDRLTSVQNLPRNEGDKEEILWLFSKAHFFLPVLSLSLVKLVWAPYQGSRERQSAWFSSVISCVSGAASTGLLPPPRYSITYTLTELPSQQQAIHVLVLPEDLLGSESLMRQSSVSRHRAP